MASSSFNEMEGNAAGPWGGTLFGFKKGVPNRIGLETAYHTALTETEAINKVEESKFKTAIENTNVFNENDVKEAHTKFLNSTQWFGQRMPTKTLIQWCKNQLDDSKKLLSKEHPNEWTGAQKKMFKEIIWAEESIDNAMGLLVNTHWRQIWARITSTNKSNNCTDQNNELLDTLVQNRLNYAAQLKQQKSRETNTAELGLSDVEDEHPEPIPIENVIDDYDPNSVGLPRLDITNSAAESWVNNLPNTTEHI